MPKNEGLSINKGRAFIEYTSIHEAKNALSANGHVLKGRPLEVSIGLNAATMSHATSRFSKKKSY